MNDEEKISKLLGELNNISAPNDFEYRVKARIAKGRPITGIRGYFTVLKYGLPAAAMALIVAVVAIQVNFMYDTDAVPPVAMDSSISRAKVKEAIEPVEVASVVEKTEETEPAVETAVIEAPTIRAERVSNNRSIEQKRRRPAQGGSYDATLSSPRNTILPPGIQNVPTAAPTAENPLEGEPIAVSDVLGQIGIDAKQSAGIWTAAAVKDGSLAENSGVKKGDIIQAIDDHQLKNVKEFTGGFSGKKITVVRDGKAVTFELR